MLDGGNINIITCSNEGDIGKGNDWCNGGILGMVNEPSVNINLYNCYNKGNIGEDKGYCGGIVGFINKAGTVIQNCYSTGSIKGKNRGGVFRTLRYRCHKGIAINNKCVLFRKYSK